MSLLWMKPTLTCATWSCIKSLIEETAARETDIKLGLEKIPFTVLEILHREYFVDFWASTLENLPVFNFLILLNKFEIILSIE